VDNEGLYKKARNRLVGGVNSPIRASVRPHPFFTQKAKGAYLWDVEGKRYCDYCLAYGPLLLGHCNPSVVNALKDQVGRGTTYGTPAELEVEYAEMFCDLAPNVEMIRTVNSGTEATMAALRLAKAVTERKEIATLEGGYHGSHDSVLAKKDGKNVTSSSKGVSDEQVCHTRMVRYNDPDSLKGILKDGTVAAFIIEPVMGNVGCVPPNEDYLKEVREICDETGTLLIFDETITGFRLAKGGAQEHYGVDADLATYGKIAGGGLPIGVIGSSRDVMENLTPVGKVYNAGTFSGNPLSMAAGLAALKEVRDGALDKVHANHRTLIKGIEGMLPGDSTVNSAPGMFQIYLGCQEVMNADDARKADMERFWGFWTSMLDAGYFLPPSHFESNFLSVYHDKDVISSTLEAMEAALR